jgi:hypothetical protein
MKIQTKDLHQYRVWLEYNDINDSLKNQTTFICQHKLDSYGPHPLSSYSPELVATLLEKTAEYCRLVASKKPNKKKVDALYTAIEGKILRDCMVLYLHWFESSNSPLVKEFLLYGKEYTLERLFEYKYDDEFSNPDWDLSK